MNVSPIPTSRIHSSHPSTLILGDPTSAVQTRSKVNKSSGAHAFVSYKHLKMKAWVDAMQEELLQFKIQKVWVLVDLPLEEAYRCQGAYEEEGIDYDEVFAPVARIEAIRIFLAFASYMGFIVYQMDVKSAFLYGKIDERPDIMFAVCACSRFQVTPKSSHLSVVKRIFREITTGGVIFLGRRLISWQCKKQTIVATSTTEAEYVAAASCCGQFCGFTIQSALVKRGGKIDVSIGLYESSGVRDYILTCTDSAKFVPWTKFCTVIETLKKNIAMIQSVIDHGFLEVSPNILSYDDNSFDTIGCTLINVLSKHGRLSEKSKGNAEFHEIIDFLKRSSIHHALTVTGQAVSISEASIRSDLLFDDANGIDSLPNQAIFYAIQLMGYEGDLTIGKKEIPSKETLGHKELLSKQREEALCKFEGTEEQIESTDGQRKGTEDHTEEGSATQATQTPTSTIFGDDETIAKVLLNMSQAKAVSREKEKGVELKDIEETDRPRPTSTRSLLTLKPLPKIDPKDKGKKKIEEEDESESESDGIPEAEKKFKQLESDEEMARKIQEEWEGEEERNRIAEEKATNEALIRNFDDIKARIEADRLLAEKLQEQEREQFTIEERAKFLHDTIAAQRKFLAQQRSEAIRNRPPTKNQLRNQMMTYLKHVGNFKHSELKTKKFEEIQALYEKIKRSDEDFISIGSAEDERQIKRMNEKGIDSSKSEVIKEESKEEVQEESKEEESTRIRKLALDEEKEVDYEILDKKYPIKEWKTECLGTKPQADKAEHLEEINQNVVIRSNGQKRLLASKY
ncbi:putative ribonuclease H-like domain-containing protein [Tanacetum coccineum]|uniref:Ribonuclease H-like domain-containing protein n=1 Tax=Tanacetum coccineum TaxID=301880 RepID=A0ABQ5EVZ7_9ASTR